MPIPLPAPVPANAIEMAISIAVLVIAFIGWIVQIAGSAKSNTPTPNRPRPQQQRPNRPQPAGGPAKPRDDRLQSEIDAFLREVSGRKPNAREPELAEEVAIEVVPDDDLPTEAIGRRPLPSQRAAAAPAARPAAPAAAAPDRPSQRPAGGTVTEWDREQQRRRERLVSTLSERHLDTSGLGSELRRHVEESLAESGRLRQEKEQVEKRLAEARAEISSLREQGGLAARPAAVKAGPTVPGKSRFVALLRDPKGVKEAVVINEILGPPKGLSGGRR